MWIVIDLAAESREDLVELVRGSWNLQAFTQKLEPTKDLVAKAPIRVRKIEGYFLRWLFQL